MKNGDKDEQMNRKRNLSQSLYVYYNTNLS